MSKTEAPKTEEANSKLACVKKPYVLPLPESTSPIKK